MMALYVAEEILAAEFHPTSGFAKDDPTLLEAKAVVYDARRVELARAIAAAARGKIPPPPPDPALEKMIRAFRKTLAENYLLFPAEATTTDLDVDRAATTAALISKSLELVPRAPDEPTSPILYSVRSFREIAARVANGECTKHGGFGRDGCPCLACCAREAVAEFNDLVRP